MAEENIEWLHSHGLINKNPDYDLGGQPSQFEIASLSKNNLFDDVTSKEAESGYTDYRCFYVKNTYVGQTFLNVKISLTTAPSCTDISFGSIFQNEQQIIEIYGEPQADGYMILEMPFGGSLITCVYTDDASFATEIQDKIRSTPYCDTCDVSLYDLGPTYVKYLVEFKGDAKNRKINKIKVVQNNLTNKQGTEYRVAAYQVTDDFNNNGNAEIKVSRNIDTANPEIGDVYIINTDTGLYVNLSYNNYLDDILYLDNSLPCDLNRGDEVWINVYPNAGSAWSGGYGGGYGNLFAEDRVKVNIVKSQEGYPINQFSDMTQIVTEQPSNIIFDIAPLDVGTLGSKEGFFVWAKRVVAPSTTGCTDSFALSLDGDPLVLPDSVDLGFTLGFL